MGPDIKFAIKLACTVVATAILLVAHLRWLVPMILEAHFAGSYIIGGIFTIFGLFAIVIGSFKLISYFYINSYKG